jgi:hypothetical protein
MHVKYVEGGNQDIISEKLLLNTVYWWRCKITHYL